MFGNVGIGSPSESSTNPISPSQVEAVTPNLKGVPFSANFSTTSASIDRGRVSRALNPEVAETAHAVSSKSLEVLASQIGEKKFNFLFNLPLVGNYIRGIVSKSITTAINQAGENGQANKAKLVIMGTRISMVFKRDADGTFKEVYLKGEKLGLGNYKQARKIYDIVNEKERAVLTPLKEGKTRRSGDKIDKEDALKAKESIQKECDHIKLLLKLAEEQGVSLEGFPPEPTIVTWKSGEEERVGMLTSLADMDVKGFYVSKPTIAERLSCIKQLANVVAFMSKNNLYHGDIKPQNILVTKDSDGIKARLADFSGMGVEGEIVDVSTSFYDAPSESGEQRDRHAFAMTVYEILTGNLMYSADNYSVDEVRGFSTLEPKDKESILNSEKKSSSGEIW